jgi:hypothetical protein
VSSNLTLSAKLGSREFDKIAGSDFGRAQRARRARAGTARVNLTLSASRDINSGQPGSADRDGNEAEITPARAAPEGRGAQRRVISPSPPRAMEEQLAAVATLSYRHRPTTTLHTARGVEI